ncbi:MAG TPA: hypothetical protein VL689_21755 [Paraburkholderia sp.]|jgi:uncharacterized protein|nr:hypothetical protein [Paraburkholderia sp.]
MSNKNRERKIRRAYFLRRSLSGAAIGLFASLAGIAAARAASFQCPHNASASERLVCNDPALSALDDKLAGLYRNAFDASPDPTSLEADRVSQWQWRQRNCKDKACVTDWYERRIAELEGDVKHGKEATVQRVKDGVVDQHLAPSAQDAVLQMHGIEPASKSDNAAPAPSTKSTLHLQKMPSGFAADARQKRLAQAYAHRLPAADATAVSQPGSLSMASVDASLAHGVTTAAKEAGPHAKESAANGLDCASVASAKPALAAQSSGERDAVEPR